MLVVATAQMIMRPRDMALLPVCYRVSGCIHDRFPDVSSSLRDGSHPRRACHPARRDRRILPASARHCAGRDARAHPCPTANIHSNCGLSTWCGVRISELTWYNDVALIKRDGCCAKAFEGGDHAYRRQIEPDGSIEQHQFFRWIHELDARQEGRREALHIRGEEGDEVLGAQRFIFQEERREEVLRLLAERVEVIREERRSQ